MTFNEPLLAGRTCVITGASRGIGLAIADLFLEQSAVVVISARPGADLDTALSILQEKHGSRVSSIPCDVSCRADITKLFREITRKFSRLDVLVCNAGIMEDSLLAMVTEEQLQRTYAVNVFGAIYCSQLGARLMQRNRSGAIIHMASIMGIYGNRGQVAYAGSKAALIGASKSMARELAELNIRVNSIAPGVIQTQLTANLSPSMTESRLNAISMKRFGTCRDVAGAALFLASDLSCYVTGQVLGLMAECRMSILAEISGNASQPAISDSSFGVCSYQQLRSLVRDAAQKFRRRELVGVICRNSVTAVVNYLALLEAGAVPLMLDSSLHHSVHADLLREFSCGNLFEADEGKWLHRGASPQLHEDLALLLSTSGSSGKPKLVRLSWGNLLSNARSIASYLRIGEKDRGITSLPIHYSYGLSILHSHLVAGASVVLTGESVASASFWDIFRKFSVTSLAGVPATWRILRRMRFERMPLPCLNTLTQAGGRMEREELEWLAGLAERMGWKFFSMYGQTEATARISFVPAECAVRKAGSIGQAIPGGRMWLRSECGEPISAPGEEGEIIYEGPNVMMGYAENPEALALGHGVSQLETGDLATLDEDGYFWISGRRSRYIKIDGRRIGLEPVERILRGASYPAIACGQDDRLVIAVEGDYVEGELLELLTRHFGILARHCFILKVESIPYSASGKVMYPELLRRASITSQDNTVC